MGRFSHTHTVLSRDRDTTRFPSLDTAILFTPSVDWLLSHLPSLFSHTMPILCRSTGTRHVYHHFRRTPPSYNCRCIYTLSQSLLAKRSRFDSHLLMLSPPPHNLSCVQNRCQLTLMLSPPQHHLRCAQKRCPIGNNSTIVNTNVPTFLFPTQRQKYTPCYRCCRPFLACFGHCACCASISA